VPSSPTDSEESVPSSPLFQYTLKIINPSRMSEFKTVNIPGQRYFKSVDGFRRFIAENLPDMPEIEKPDFVTVEMGYVEPGHGSKGRKVWVYADSDLRDMYKRHQRKKHVLLWCYSKKSSSQDKKTVKGSSVYEKKISEVDEIYEKLQDKHKHHYTPEQLRAWAHLVQMGKHVSLQEPPDKPYFRGRKRTSSSVESNSSASTPERKKRATVAVSPGRKVTIRTELIDQLQKWHHLMESGAISESEYKELQQTILCDIKQL